MEFLFICFALGGILLCYLALVRRSDQSTELTVPGPPKHWIIGSAGILLAHGELHGWRKAIDLGDRRNGICSMTIGTSEIILVTHHDDLKKVFFDKHSKSGSSKVLAEAPHHMKRGSDYARMGETCELYFLGRKSILFLDADDHQEWLRVRKVLGKSFLSTALKPLFDPVSSVVTRFCRYLERDLNRSPAPVELAAALRCLSYDILGAAAFSQDFGAIACLEAHTELPPILQAFVGVLRESNRRSPQRMILQPWLKPRYIWIPTKSNCEFRRNRDLLFSEVDHLISARKAALSPDRPDMLQILLDSELPGSYVRDNLLTVLFAGHDTTATTLQFLLYNIAAHPVVQKRLQTEVDLRIPSLSFASFSELVYCRQVVTETLRLFPPVHFTVRAVQKDVELHGHLLPSVTFIDNKGTTVGVPLFWAQRDEYNWKNPEEFDPDRHAPGKEAPFSAFMAFMIGQRNCIGKRFAMLSLIVTLAHLVHHFEFRVPRDYSLEVTTRGVMLAPKMGIRLLISAR